MSIRANATHGVVFARDEGRERYFGWPSIVRLGDGTLVVGVSGPREAHICPWGKESIGFSRDEGQTWDGPRIVHNDMIDNRDCGVVALGGQKFAITWFSIDPRLFDLTHQMEGEVLQEAYDYMNTWNQDTVEALQGSWMKITEDGGKTWSRAIRVPVSTPHGFTVLKDGTYAYLGRRFPETNRRFEGDIIYASSRDGGYTWQMGGKVPTPDDVGLYCEPYTLELKDGTLLGVFRYEVRPEDGGGMDTVITRSTDGGATWSMAERMNIGGSPPHLLRHSSGAIVLSYGWRRPGYGIRARVSYDEGNTWSDEIILRDDANCGDLGYPCSVELNDGSIYTVYYFPRQSKGGETWVRSTAVYWTKWTLPEV